MNHDVFQVQLASGGQRILAARLAVVRVLLTDGSGLTSRQVATQLSMAGHVVEVLTPDRLALTRFTRHVRRVHPVPPFGTAPFEWLDAAVAVYRTGGFDVLLPTQEQAAVLSRSAQRLHGSGVATAVPSFDALIKVQDKLAARATLAELGLPQPDGSIVLSAAELKPWGRRLPVYIKVPIGQRRPECAMSPSRRNWKLSPRHGRRPACSATAASWSSRRWLANWP